MLNKTAAFAVIAILSVIILVVIIVIVIEKAKLFKINLGKINSISDLRWVLNTLDKMDLKNPPVLVLLPLGTGNDLARSLGYGTGEDSSLNVR